MARTELIKGIMGKTIEKIRTDIQANMIRYNRNATGETSRSLRTEVVETPTGFSATLYGKEYPIKVLQYGRGPTSSSGETKVDLVSIIEDWIVTKGISVYGNYKLGSIGGANGSHMKNVHRAAHNIAFTIQKYGTQLKRDKGFQDIMTTSVNTNINAFMAKVPDLFVKAYLDTFFEQ